MFKLQVLLLAKMQWDLRQSPAVVSTSAAPPAPASLPQDLARVVPHMVSPCVAGDLLRQRAPGLLQNKRRCKRKVANRNGGRRREMVEESLTAVVSTPQLSDFSFSMSCCLKACKKDNRVFDVVGGCWCVP
jgi:hypothetical protein